MPTWAIALLSSLGTGLLFFLLNLGKDRLIPKSQADTANELTRLHGTQDRLKDDVLSVDERVKLEGRLTRIETRIDHIEGAQTDFLKFLEKVYIPLAHSPHTPDLDRLLEKRDRGEELTAAEWQEMIKRLGEEARDPSTPPGKRVAIASLQAVYLTMLRSAKMKEQRERMRTSSGHIAQRT